MGENQHEVGKHLLLAEGLCEGSISGATAFSPTDAMPLTRLAKALMAAESTLSAITVLLIAAHAVNIRS